MKKRVLYFFPLVGSLSRSEELGTLSRIRAEIGLWEEEFDITFMSKDTEEFFIFPQTKHLHMPAFLSRVANFAYLLSPFLKWKEFRNHDLYYVDHISSGFAAVVGKLLFRKRVVVRFNWHWSYFVRKEESFLKFLLVFLFEKIALMRADVIIASTHSLAEIAAKKVGKKAKVVVVPNWVDTSLFKPVATEKKKHSLVSIGRLEYQKNYQLLLRSLKASGNGFSLTLIGDGSMKEELKSYAARHNISLTIHERVANEELPRQLASHSLYVSTSRYEGHPKALVEAMACGLPVVATDTFGNNDVIKHEKTGILCEPSVARVTQAIVTLIEDTSLAERLSKNAARDTQTCSMESVLGRIFSIVGGSR